MNVPERSPNGSQAVKSFVVIPARLASTRLPRKLLLRETGRSVLQHTYEQAKAARLPLGVCIAADHEEILREAKAFGGKAVMTSPHHQSGTDRVAELAHQLPDVEIFVNVQGDEPELPPQAIDQVVQLLVDDPDADMATLSTPIRSAERLRDPACVKVVFDRRGKAMYFSRAAIPFMREWDETALAAEPPCFHQHIGLYAYRRDYLLKITSQPPSSMEKIEKLEQLRVLEGGGRIVVGSIPQATRGVDTPDDYREFVQRFYAAQPGRKAA